jgi:uncharacterized membrane protein YgcG
MTMKYSKFWMIVAVLALVGVVAGYAIAASEDAAPADPQVNLVGGTVSGGAGGAGGAAGGAGGGATGGGGADVRVAQY